MAIHTPKTRDDLARLMSPLRLDAAVFERAVMVGAAESRTFSPGAPATAPEFIRWARTVEAVHEGLMLMRLDWRHITPQGLDYFVQPEIRLGFVVSSGDAFTGSPFGSPSNRNAKGESFGQRVDSTGTPAMLGEMVGNTEVFVDDFRVFLYSERDGFVHVELSVPRARHGGFVDGWSDRILFPAFDLALGAFAFEESGDEGDFGFTIARR